MNFSSVKFLCSRYLPVLLLLACGFSACRLQKNDPVAVINTITRGALGHETRNIILIRDNKCLSCSQKLVRFAGSITPHADCLTVVAADPDRIDLSPVLAAPQCYMDSERLLDRSGILPDNMFMQVRNGKMFSMTELNAGNLDSFIHHFACTN